MYILLFATIKKSSKYFGQDHRNGKPEAWPITKIDSKDAYGYHGNRNCYRKQDLQLWAKLPSGELVKL